MIESEGWVLVVLLRLSPIVPWNLLNIAMATTRIHFLSFTLASAIGARHTKLQQGLLLMALVCCVHAMFQMLIKVHTPMSACCSCHVLPESVRRSRRPGIIQLGHAR